LPHHHNKANLQAARIEYDNAEHFDTITEDQTMECGSTGQITWAQRFSGIAQDEEEHATDDAFELTK